MKKFDKVYKTIMKESKIINEASKRFTYEDLLKQLKELDQQQLRLPVVTLNRHDKEYSEGIDFYIISDIAREDLENKSDEISDSDIKKYVNKELGYKNENHPIIIINN